MEKHKIDANESFFDNLISTLKEGGIWGWPDEMEFFTKKDGKLHGTKYGLEQIKSIVSENYFKTKFAEINEK